MLHLFVDADACPVKAEVVRVAQRYGLPVTMVAGSRMRIPEGDRVRLEVVGGELDAADRWIAERVEPDDLVVTTDVPLAARCLERGAAVVRPDGRQLTPESIGSALATRDLLHDLRSFGESSGGPPPFTKRDRSRFLDTLDRVIQAIRRRTDSTGH